MSEGTQISSINFSKDDGNVNNDQVNDQVNDQTNDQANDQEASKRDHRLVGTKSNVPTEIVELPSKGLLYPASNPLSEGYIEIKYMTAKEEDIISTESYIKNNKVIEKLLRSLIVTKVNYNDLLLGDKNAIMIAARKFGYGEDYEATVTTPSGNDQKVYINLDDIESKAYEGINIDDIERHTNRFEFELPVSKDVITFKILTVGDNKQILDDLKRRKKSKRQHGDAAVTTRMEKAIIAVNGENINNIEDYVSSMLARDSRSFRKYYADIQPDIDLNFEFEDEETGEPFRSDVTIGAKFLYPDG